VSANAMTIIVLLIGIVEVLMGVVLGFIIRALTRAETRIDKTQDDLAAFKADVPVRYANETDIKRVEEAISAVRHELNAFTTETRTTLVNIAATVNQIVGASNHRG
jgi:hypothetical protein